MLGDSPRSRRMRFPHASSSLASFCVSILQSDSRSLRLASRVGRVGRPVLMSDSDCIARRTAARASHSALAGGVSSVLIVVQSGITPLPRNRT